jgi:dienelactone hydrolase
VPHRLGKVIVILAAMDAWQARELHQKTKRENMIAAALAAIPFMQKHAESTGKVGAVGFCFGGGVVNRMPRSRRRRALLRRADPCRDGAGHQGAAAAAICGERREHQ